MQELYGRRPKMSEIENNNDDDNNNNDNNNCTALKIQCFPINTSLDWLPKKRRPINDNIMKSHQEVQIKAGSKFFTTWPKKECFPSAANRIYVEISIPWRFSQSRCFVWSPPSTRGHRGTGSSQFQEISQSRCWSSLSFTEMVERQGIILVPTKSHRVNPCLDPTAADRSCRNFGVLPKSGLGLSPNHVQGEENRFNTHKVVLVLLNLLCGIPGQ